MKHDGDFGVERELLPLFRKQSIITVTNNLIDPNGFNLKNVPSGSYKIFTPVFLQEKGRLENLLKPDCLTNFHMLGVRAAALDRPGEEYLFIRGYRVGHTLELEMIVVVVEAQVKGGCNFIDPDGHIGGDGKGRWYAVLCPAEAESELVADLKADEARRRKLLPKCYFKVNKNFKDFCESIPEDER